MGIYTTIRPKRATKRERRALCQAIVEAMDLFIHPIRVSSSGTCWLVADMTSRRCAIVDPIFGVDSAVGVDGVLEWVRGHLLVVRWILDTQPSEERCAVSRLLRSRLLCAQTCSGAEAQVEGYDRYVSVGDRLDLGNFVGRVVMPRLGPGEAMLGAVGYDFDGHVLASTCARGIEIRSPGTMSSAGAMPRLSQCPL